MKQTKTKKEYIGIIKIYKNVYIEAYNDADAWSLFNEKIKQEAREIDDCYFVDVENSHLTK